MNEGAVTPAYRIERDTMGEIRVPSDRYWGAQTQRSHENFVIGGEVMPIEMIRALAQVKRACAAANHSFGKLDARRADLIMRAADEIVAGQWDDQFPLLVWQTGSGTQTNMNVNEVIAHRGNELAGEVCLHPNDHVNMSQSTNDVFPTAMHVASVTALVTRVLPAIEALIETFRRLEAENEGIMKSGRTHLMDATPIRFAQEISGWRGMLETSRRMIEATLPTLCALAVGGTAVGTGLNAPKWFGAAVAERLTQATQCPFTSEENKFHALASRDAVVFAHGALKALAANLLKIANDVRWLASGPRCGLGEIFIPENEPGSSIMPGKVNPTQCEALSMVAVQVMGNDVALGVAASQGNFELNVYMPVIAYDFLQSARLLADAMDSFRTHCADGIRANVPQMTENLHRSLMTVTALTPHIGYEAAAKVAKRALHERETLRESCLALGYASAEQFDEWFHPEQMA